MTGSTRPVALITGASSGIGAALARELAADGHDLILVARSEPALAALAAELKQAHGTDATVLAADLGKPGAVDALFRRVGERGAVVDVLVNNAGYGDGGFFHEEEPARIDGMIALNIGALTDLTRVFLPGMIERRRGRILQVASTAAYQPGPMMAVYCATKAYVLSLSLALSEEVRGTGVTVTALCPGATKTNFAKVANIEKNPLFSMMAVMSPAAVARQGYQALKRGQRVVVTGMTNRVGALMGSLLPYGMVLPMSKRLLAPGR
jgi:hypothetical protein